MSITAHALRSGGAGRQGSSWAPRAPPNKSRASRYRIVRCVDESECRPRTDLIDLYQIHMQDLTIDGEETLGGLDDLVRAGKVGHDLDRGDGLDRRSTKSRPRTEPSPTRMFCVG